MKRHPLQNTSNVSNLTGHECVIQKRSLLGKMFRNVNWTITEMGGPTQQKQKILSCLCPRWFLPSIGWCTITIFGWLFRCMPDNRHGFQLNQAPCIVIQSTVSHIAKFMGPTWGSPGSCRPQMSPMLAPWTLLLGVLQIMRKRVCGTLCVGNIPWSLNFFSTRKLLW